MEVLTQAMLSGKNMLDPERRNCLLSLKYFVGSLAPAQKQHNSYYNDRILAVELRLDQLIIGLYLAFSRVKHFLGKVCFFSPFFPSTWIQGPAQAGLEPSLPLSWITGMITTLGTVCS